MKKILLSLVLIIISSSINGQNIFGKWHSTNEDSGEIDSVIEVYKKDGKAYEKIIDVKDPTRRNAICTQCLDDNKNKPILGLNILTGLKKEGKEWSGGTILDPRNGKIYKCYLQLSNPNTLKIRGYIGISLFGKTAYWKRAG